MAILRTVVWFAYFFSKLLLLLPSMWRAQRCKARGNMQGLSDIIQSRVPQWANRLLWLAGVTVTVNGSENIPTDRAVMFTPNHQGNYDIPLVLTQLGRVYPLVAKVELTKLPFVRRWMSLFDCVFLDRKNPRKAVTAMKQAGELLAQGTSVIVFPEGTRSKGGPMGEFKSGAFRIAFSQDAAIVPVAIDGSYLVMEANHNLMRPAHVTITILPPVETAGLDRAAQKLLPDKIAAQIAACLSAPVPLIQDKP